MIVASGTLDFLSVNVWHILMAIGNLLILVLILKKFLFKPVQNILKQREEEISGAYSKAEEALKEAESERELYREKLDGAKAEADELIESASKRAKAESAEIIANARKEAAVRRKHAEEDIELSRRKAAEELKGTVSEMVIELASEVVGREIDEKAHKELIDEAISSLGE